MRKSYTLVPLILIILGLMLLLNSGNNQITLMATTTTRDAGLMSVIVDALKKDTNLDVRVIAFGTGKVLRSAEEGNADIILVHDPVAEKTFMEQGYGSERFPLMRNDFVIVGPSDDPASIRTIETASQAFKNIIASKQVFISRADNSGTHQAELRIWHASNLNPDKFPGANYIETGTGMGRTLNVAVEKNAYLLVDRATWETFQNKGTLDILFSRDEFLTNIYSIISVNSDRYDHISTDDQAVIMNWFKSEKARQIINQFRPNNTQLFYSLNNLKN